MSGCPKCKGSGKVVGTRKGVNGGLEHDMVCRVCGTPFKQHAKRAIR